MYEMVSRDGISMLGEISCCEGTRHVIVFGTVNSVDVEADCVHRRDETRILFSASVRDDRIRAVASNITCALETLIPDDGVVVAWMQSAKG